MVKTTHFTGQPIFNQLLLLIPRSLIRRLSRQYQADHYCKKFKSYDHLVTMLFGIFHQCSSLRELITGMQACCMRLKHLGLINTPRRSTLADANQRRPAVFFEDLYHELYHFHYKRLPDSLKGKKVLDRLFIIDSTTISLFSTVMAGTGNYGLNGKKKGGIKAHMLVQARQNVPCFVRLTEAKQHDQNFLPLLHLPERSIIVMDRAYRNYAQLRTWTQQKITWITRANIKTHYKITDSKPLTGQQRKAGVRKDYIIELGNPLTKRLNPIQKARLVIFYDRENKTWYEFITNDFRLAPLTIADLYKKRWQIELLFKRIKQNFNIHDFLGDNENAIRIQLWCTLIADLLIKIVKDKTAKKRKWSMANLAGLIKLHLGTYINLYNFLTNPEKALLNYQPPNYNQQLQLFIT